MLPVNSRKIEMSDVKTLREKRGVGILPAFILVIIVHIIYVEIISIQYFYSTSDFPAHTRRGG